MNLSLMVCLEVQVSRSGVVLLGTVVALSHWQVGVNVAKCGSRRGCVYALETLCGAICIRVSHREERL